MLRNFKQEFKDMRSKVTLTMQSTNPAKEFGATMILALINLGLIETRMRNTRNLNERRRLINEFDRVKKAIAKAHGALVQAITLQEISETGQRVHMS